MVIKIVSEVRDEEAFKAVVQALKENFEEEVVIEYVKKIAKDKFFNPARRQYNAREIVGEVAGKHMSQSKSDRILFVVDGDIYVPGLNFVFGLAWLNMAIISTYRLRQEFYGLEPDRKLFIQRLMKEATHEIGHLLGLGHCSNRRCVMAFSNWIGDTDHKSWRLCPECSRKLRR